MPRLSSVLSAPMSTADTQACVGEPYHLADGMDLRPRRTSGGYHRDRVGGPRPEMVATEGRVERGQGEQNVRRGARGGYRFAEGRVRAVGRDTGERTSIGTSSSRSGIARTSRTSCTLTRRTPGSLDPGDFPPGRRWRGRPRTTFMPRSAQDTASDARDRAATCGSSTGMTARAGDALRSCRYSAVQVSDDSLDVRVAGRRKSVPASQPATDTNALDAEPHRSAESTGNVVAAAQPVGDERADYDNAQTQYEAQDEPDERVEDQVLEARVRKRSGTGSELCYPSPLPR